jgi:hypothetical protein
MKKTYYLHIYKIGDNLDYNYKGIPLLSTSQHFSHNFFLKFNSHIDEIIGNHQCGFQHNRSTIIIGELFCIRRCQRYFGSGMGQNIIYF